MSYALRFERQPGNGTGDVIIGRYYRGAGVTQCIGATSVLLQPTPPRLHIATPEEIRTFARTTSRVEPSAEPSCNVIAPTLDGLLEAGLTAWDRVLTGHTPMRSLTSLTESRAAYQLPHPDITVPDVFVGFAGNHAEIDTIYRLGGHTLSLIAQADLPYSGAYV